VAATVERTAETFPNRTAVLFEGQQVTWQELNALANQYANVFKTQGLKRGDAVSVFMENRIEFLATCIGLNKIGATAGLINTNLRGRPLTHCVQVTESAKCVFGEELADAMAEVKDELSLKEGEDFFWVPDRGSGNPETAPDNWSQNLAALAGQAGDDNLAETGEVVLGDNAFYIFTSGTTGLPKAAVLSNRRYLASAMLSAKAGLKCTEKDRLYICLPLYHGTGLMIGVGASIASGASMFIRRKFSASNFPQRGSRASDHVLHLHRRTVPLPHEHAAADDDHKNPMTRMMGNGLRPDIWKDFKKRFGVKRIAEFYGASEGNVAFANLLNKDCTVGMTSVRHALVKYDVDADEIIRDENGRCIEVQPANPVCCSAISIRKRSSKATRTRKPPRRRSSATHSKTVTPGSTPVISCAK
jgi:citronellyl-CoA synthetase